MARSVIPDPLERRHLLEQELDPKAALRIAEAYLEAGRPVDALPFLERADESDRIRALAAEAVRDGDAFLLREVTRSLGEAPAAENWQDLARAADEKGKERYAADARRLAQRGED